MMLGLTPIAWEAIGFLGQGLFTARFLVQWLASEKKGESIVPISFWWLSLTGSAVLAAYAAFGRNEPVFLLVSLINGFLYARNLYLAYFARDRATSRKVLIPAVLAIAAFLVFVGSGRIDPEVPVVWLAIGFLGTACWSGRFVIQWYASERAGKSVVPRSFWYVGLAGAVLLLSYSIYQRMPVFILGYLFPLFPYLRNLTLIFRKEGAPRPVRLAQEVWRDPGRRGNAVAIFCVVLSAFLTVRAIRSDPGSEFERLYRAATLVAQGRAAEVYDGDVSDRLDRPPALAVVLAPMGLLPDRSAVANWTVVNGLAVLLALHLVWRLVRREGVRAAWMWFPFFIGLRFAWDAMNRGHPMPLVLLLLAGGLERAVRRTLSSVLLFTLTTVVSPFLGALAAWCACVFHRRPALIVGTLVASTVLAILLPAMVLGPQGTILVLEDYLVLAEGELGQYLGLSDLARDPRLAPAVRSVIGFLCGYPLLLVAAGLLPLAIAAIRGRRRSPGVVYGVLVAIGVGISRTTEQEHFLLLVLPAAALVVECVRAGRARARVWIGSAALLGAIALAAVPSRAIVGKKTSDFLIDHGSLPLAALILAVGLLVAGSRESDETAREG